MTDAMAVAGGAQLLLVEDDSETALDVIDELTALGYRVRHATDGRQGLALACDGDFDAIVLDRMLPGLDGLALVAALRQAERLVPVLMMSALGDVDERVKGLKAGGDDYLAKPFAMIELVARLEALLRRPALARGTQLQVGELVVDLIERTVRRGSRVIELLPREFKLLDYFMRHPGQILTRAMLLENVWNYRFPADTNLVDVHIGKLRRKIDAPGEPPLIQCVRRAGFMLVADR